MTIDWQKEVEARKEELLEDLKNLLRVNSELMHLLDLDLEMR